MDRRSVDVRDGIVGRRGPLRRDPRWAFRRREESRGSCWIGGSGRRSKDGPGRRRRICRGRVAGVMKDHVRPGAGKMNDVEKTYVTDMTVETMSMIFAFELSICR